MKKRKNDGIPFENAMWVVAGVYFLGGCSILARLLSLYLDFCIPELIISSIVALASFVLAIFVVPMIKKAMKLKTPQQYEDLLKNQRESLQTLQRSITALQRRVS